MTDLQKTIEGKYEILGKLREGGMGAVYRVRHRLLDEVRVVKVIRPHLGASPGLADRFLREARSAIQLRHPNIAQLYDFSVDDEGGAFIVMELIDGATLEDLVKSGGPPPLGLALEIAQQSLRAIGFLHRKGFLHRDITPDNLMLTRDVDGYPLVKLIDLGIAKLLTGAAGGGDLTVAGLFLGKPRYASPEQFSGGADKVDARSDLYSFGTVLYEQLTGVPPITGRDASSLMAGHLFRPPVPFADSDPEGRIPPDLRAIVEKTLAKRPEERYASAAELAASLGAVQQRFPVVPGDLERALEPAAYAAAAPRRDMPGSTQDELDRRFAQGVTPPPVDRTVQIFETVPPPPPPRVPTAAPSRLDLPLVSPEAMPTLILPRRQEAPREPPRWRRAGPWEAVAALLLVALVVAGILIWSRLPEKKSPSPPPTATTEANAATAPVVADAVPAASAAPDASPRNPPPPTAPVPAETEAVAQPTAQAPIPRPAPGAVSPPATKQREVVEVPVDVAGETQGTARRGRARREEEPPMKRGDMIFGGPDVTGPRLTSPPSYAYPPALAGTGRYALVLVEVLVDENGAVVESRVESASVDDGSSDAEFKKAALDAARQARFAPATRGGIPGRMWGNLTFEFGTKK